MISQWALAAATEARTARINFMFVFPNNNTDSVLYQGELHSERIHPIAQFIKAEIFH